MAELREGVNTEKSKMSEFTDRLAGKLGLIALSDEELESMGLTLAQIRYPLLVLGTPGLGKTCSVISTIQKVNRQLPPDKQFAFKKVQLGQTVVGDLQGVPVVLKDGTVKRVQIPDLPETDPTKPDYSEYGVLFLDEITTVDEAQMQPALGLADDSRSIGTYHLPEHWYVVAAGNGPDCSNFMRLDDVMLMRFEVFDIAFDYRKDWQAWAHANGIAEEIIAFLNFDETVASRVESTEMDEVGKCAPCPRTWTACSIAIREHQAQHKGDFWPQDQIAHNASRIIGAKAAREFAAFCAFRQKVDYDPKKILAGTEKDPDGDMEKQVFHILIQNCIKQLKIELKGKGTDNKQGQKDYPAECITKVANFIKWIIKFEKTNLENCLQSFIEVRNSCPEEAEILLRSDFSEYCPDFDDFMTRNASYFLENEADFANL